MIGVQVKGLEEAQRALERLEAAELKKLLQKSTSAGAKALKPYVVRETPRRTGRMRKSVSAGQARKERPAAIVKFRPKVAYYRAFVIRGTHAHRIRFPDQKRAGVSKADGNIRHPGARANDVMGRATDAGGRSALDAIDKVIHDYLEQS